MRKYMNWGKQKNYFINKLQNISILRSKVFKSSDINLHAHVFIIMHR